MCSEWDPNVHMGDKIFEENFIRKSINCNTPNVVYYIICECNTPGDYIGYEEKVVDA